MTPLEWEEVYLQYYGKVMGYVIARVQHRADAEDICSEVFEKAFRKIGEYDHEKASLSTWIYAITRNTVIDYYRKRRPTEELDETMKSDFTVDSSLLKEETLGALAEALKALPQEQRDIIVLVYYDGKPLTEVARLMRLSYGAVKIRHQKALARLKELIG